MNRGLYSAGVGMASAERMLDSISHNLANASTQGYKRDAIVFNESLERVMYANGGTGARIGTLGSGPGQSEKVTIFEAGTISTTGNPMDIALEDPDIMIAVQTPAGTRYTRGGALSVSADGFLTNAGAAILNENGEPIRVFGREPKIEHNGSVTIDGREIAKISFARGTFSKVGAGLFLSEDAAATPGRIRVGAIESSNVNAISEMVALIRLNRAFELAQKSSQTHDQSTEKLIQSLQAR